MKLSENFKYYRNSFKSTITLYNIVDKLICDSVEKEFNNKDYIKEVAIRNSIFFSTYIIRTNKEEIFQLKIGLDRTNNITFGLYYFDTDMSLVLIKDLSLFIESIDNKSIMKNIHEFNDNVKDILLTITNRLIAIN